MAARPRSRYALAIAGIAATALVGVAGTAGSWLVAREDRSAQRQLARDERASERRLAHEQRIYDRRAAAYVDALVLMDRQRDELVAVAGRLLKNPSAREVLGNRKPLLAQDQVVYARVRAYGSDSLIQLYVRLRVDALGLWGAVLAHPAREINFTSFRNVENAFARAARGELR